MSKKIFFLKGYRKNTSSLIFHHVLVVSIVKLLAIVNESPAWYHTTGLYTTAGQHQHLESNPQPPRCEAAAPTTAPPAAS